MTDDRLNAVPDDIAYIRAMAVEGRNAPLLNGPILVSAGTIFGLASLGQWAIQTGIVSVPPIAQLWLWLGTAAVFAGALFVLIRRQSRRPGFHSAGNKAVGAAWSGVGYGIFALWIAFMAAGLVNGDWALMQAMPMVVLAFYGSAWLVAGAKSGLRWMGGVALMSYAGAALLGAFVDSPMSFPVYAGVLFAVAILPGLALMRQEPAEVV